MIDWNRTKFDNIELFYSNVVNDITASNIFLKLTINLLFQFERRSLEYVEWNIYGKIYLNDTSLNESQAPWLNVFSACNSFLESTLQ